MYLISHLLIHSFDSQFYITVLFSTRHCSTTSMEMEKAYAFLYFYLFQINCGYLAE